MPSSWFIFYLVAMNIATYFFMALDKQRAVRQQWRIAEKYLLALCFCGGFIGMHIAMQHHHHKTQHWYFKGAVMLSSVGFLVILPTVVLYLKNG